VADTRQFSDAFIRSVMRKRMAVGLISEVLDPKTNPRWVRELLFGGVSREALERVARALVKELAGG
jgi:hypothetical protein